MSIKGKALHILAELKGHLPFTFFGAALGISFMLIFKGIDKSTGATLFSVFHPTHVVLSAMVTASLFGLHREKKNFVAVLLIGYFGSIGIATLSDSVIPYFGEKVLGLDVPSHADLYAHSINEQAHSENGNGVERDDHSSGMHLGFIEEWYIINPAAILGVLIAFFLPHTKFPHAGHVLISTWASSAHILMNAQNEITTVIMFGIFVVLLLAVWIPCCISDIVFPLLFVRSDLRMEEECERHGRHSHAHIH